MFDYKLLQAFHMVVTTGGFEKAARELFITQSAVSQRVKLLEEQMGQVLLSRTSPPRPTPQGLKLLKHFGQVSRLEQDLKADLLPSSEQGFNNLALGVNADSLATWFPKAVTPLIRTENLLLNLLVDDQEQTHRFMRQGKVQGCVSVQKNPLQGCKAGYLGYMEYRLLASSEFTAKWFPHGVDSRSLSQAPGVLFNLKDELHTKMVSLVLGEKPPTMPLHHIPSVKQFNQLIADGLAYGVLPDQQAGKRLKSGLLRDLSPGHSLRVRLYWHYWNLKSGLLERFSTGLIKAAQGELPV
ncbi:LysR family transcriptional regulator ArgP [Dethiosulfatarculus sandiegensis]|uniref:Chromosome replication initiation inhibitor protein n=1 Tax=Dethiosulfatarculus sandiegensis TaxID=1429043 RepID=A0A0D2JIY1_9BACT|nr:LysR family transcriptional regulator ArgP [Dethiosulfatarculus sandiegensis]KIX15641.1 chromosome replication initiation inhibitor protein [Dethiosulfatarculus sandiegensis]